MKKKTTLSCYWSGDFYTFNVFYIAVNIIQLIRLQQPIVPYTWSPIHVPEASFSGHLNGISVKETTQRRIFIYKSYVILA